jgi:hypothetical protein
LVGGEVRVVRQPAKVLEAMCADGPVRRLEAQRR